MQLGTRWAMGSEPPARLPERVIAAIREVERRDTAASPSRRWTLTWLEGLPIVDLDPEPESDIFTTIRVNPDDDTATIASYDSGDESVEE